MDARRFSLLVAFSLCAGSARALMLGGTEVPKDKVVVYFLMGHSNMAGEDNVNSDGTTAPRIWNYEWFKAKQWAPAKETPGADRNGLSGRGEGGPGMPFLKAMALANPGYHFAVISNAMPSSTLRGENDGHNGSGIPADENRYWKGAILYGELLAAGLEVKDKVTFGGILCMLGSVEATRTSEEICRAFSDDAATMVRDFRTDLGAPNLPFIMGEYEAGAAAEFALSQPWPAIIDQQIKQIPSKLDYSATVDSKGIPMLDNHHYNQAGVKIWAGRAVSLIAAKGWIPPPSGSASLFAARGRNRGKRTPGPVFISGSGLEAFFPAIGDRRFLADGSRP